MSGDAHADVEQQSVVKNRLPFGSGNVSYLLFFYAPFIMKMDTCSLLGAYRFVI
ncbi:hypothetical protein BPUM_1735 [Bacillus pumilus SAFR-032]|uniref:Uncharacterized protein n=1 Tax=Bacillus pumilus (strain SAFR-032) TaxID=315750 RepID=A8FDU0_BACP2|nr:hypothetical protein BPUM_1735 [Bacillus pumilus SAFR-032]